MIQVLKNPATPDFATKRNRFLLEYFEKYLGPDRVRLIGKADAPAVIVDNKHALSCYAHNFDLYLNPDWVSNAQCVHLVKLGSANAPQLDNKTFFEWIETANHREVFAINLEGTPLYVSGANYVDQEFKQGPYPVFSTIGYKLYFSRGFAVDKIDELERNPLCAGLNFKVV